MALPDTFIPPNFRRYGILYSRTILADMLFYIQEQFSQIWYFIFRNNFSEKDLFSSHHFNSVVPP